VLSALVPNAAGLTNLLAANEAALALGVRQLIGKVSVFTAASESFAQKNTNATIAQTLERFVPVVESAKAHGLRVRGYVSCVIACPFEGAISPAKVRHVVDCLLKLGVDEVDLGDTIGAGTPASVRALLHDMRDLLPAQSAASMSSASLSNALAGEGEEHALTLHLHDTFGQAGECVREALALGVRSFDASVAGLGGCPYASLPGKPAPGNVKTELVVRIAKEMGFACGVDEAKLGLAAAFARTLTSRGLRDSDDAKPV
jgi:hydroxymethylglutaryl-CoA lyase